jgi:hypothetical protein
MILDAESVINLLPKVLLVTHQYNHHVRAREASSDNRFFSPSLKELYQQGC